MVDQNAPDLTSREAELMELVARGYTNKEIAERVFLSPHTVKTHLKQAFRKCGVRNRVEAASWWSRQGGPTPASARPPTRAQAAPARWRSRWGVLVVGGTAVPAMLAAVALAVGGLGFAGDSASALEYCVAEASSSQDGQRPPTATCFETQEAAISFATDGAASSIEELPRASK